MADRNGAQLVVSLLVLVSKFFALTGWPAVVAVDIMSVSEGGHPYQLPFFNIALAGLTVLSTMAIADWVLRRTIEHQDQILEAIRTEAAEAYARGYAEAAAVRTGGGRLVAVDKS